MVTKFLLDYKQHCSRVHCIYTFMCLLYFLDYSNGGYQQDNDEELLDFENSLNVIPTEDPFRHLTNFKRLEPYFDPNVNQNVTALVGKSAYLNCIVKNLGNKTVAWIRHRDLHILTVSTYTYTTDLRFQTMHHRSTDEWTLQIKWVQKRDAGVYECQVSTQPVKSYSVNLNVIDLSERKMMNRRFFHPYEAQYNDEHHPFFHSSVNGVPLNDIYGRMYSDLNNNYVPAAQIIGGSGADYYISKGSTINLTCIVKYSQDPPDQIYWHFKNKILSFESEPRLSTFTENGDTFTNYLLIKDVNMNDSGKYVCAPSNAEPASILVHVVSARVDQRLHNRLLEGENPEAYSAGSTQFETNSFCSTPRAIMTLALMLHFMFNFVLTKHIECLR